MILSFKHKGLEKFFNSGSTAGIQAKHAVKLRILLFTLDNATSPRDMSAPNWHLHQLSGDLANHWSVRVNGNWRMTFKFENGDATIVDYQDYH